ncbi:hypothetical protein [Alkalihalobacillus sp. AL-G]|uniref:hypothetical protein n=1 Tax=Alkalihalobacillus sp. AL-G TaxID=2926399 RepID=UPI00272CA2E3|nr:hypothetical protein [Alkalihalobacillus sp. AL-G]WLD92513.1 hypothetical protein MOJ78_16055 [Alkalihalobacillus sp. AL-G]
MELSYQRTINYAQRSLSTFFNEYRVFFEIYRIRGWVWSVFTPFIIFVPVYLWYAAFDHFSFASIIQFGLSVVLLLTWICLPAIFLYLNSDRHIIAKIWFWAWTGLMLVSIVLWGMWLNG